MAGISQSQMSETHTILLKHVESPTSVVQFSLYVLSKKYTKLL